MKTKINRLFIAIMLIAATAATVSAKTYDIVVDSEPQGATVYLNGFKVSDTTPAVIPVDKKIATKIMIFKFEKEGYESKSITVSYTKDQLKYNPTVKCQMKKKGSDKANHASADPTVTEKQRTQRVDRKNAGNTDMERTIIRWYFDSEPRGTRIFYRVISSVPNEVKNTNETYLTTTPYEETRSFNIIGLTYDNSRDVTIEIKASKRGYEDQVKRFNVRQALDQQEISAFFDLVKKETADE